MIKKTKKKDIVVAIAKKVSPIVKGAQSLVIDSPDSLRTAVETLSKLNSYLDRVVLDREKITVPMNAALKDVRAKYKPIESTLETAIELIRGKMSVFQTASMQAQKEAEAKIAAKVEAGKIDLDTAVSKLNAIEAPAQGVRTDVGMVNFKTVKKLKITNPSLVPDEFWFIDEAVLFAALKNGRVVPGAEIEEIQVAINYRA